LQRGGAGEKTHMWVERPRSDDLLYGGVVVEVPQPPLDPLDEHGAPRDQGTVGPLCSYCGRSGGNRVAYDGLELTLHRECEDPWIKEEAR
jgi:hypothetical protein